MRKTGSRDPRESLEASAVSPFSIAVNTFSIRLGSRRNQRPLHQKIRSITTVSPMIDTIKIGHMIGPPLWNLSINQLLERTLGAGVADGATLAAAVAAGLSAPAGAGLVATPPGATGCPTAPGCPGAPGCPSAPGCPAAPGCPGAAGCCAPGCPGGTFVAGACWAAAAGFVGASAAGLVPAAAGGAFAGGGDCASEISANASEHTEVVSSVFIVEAGV